VIHARFEDKAAAPSPACGALRDPLISIVVAFYNEEDTIGAFFREMGRVVESLPCTVEYVCVNDGSRDRTLDLLRAQMTSTPNMRIVGLARNFGKEAAMVAGLVEAWGDAAVLIDADLQDPPALIADFVAKWREGYDVVYGVRTSRAVDSALKRWTARAYYALFDALTEIRIPQGAGDFRLLDRRVVDALLRLPERNRFTKGLFSWVGFRQTGVEFVREARVAGGTKWSYLRLLNFAVDGLTSFSIAPLRIASLAGVLVSLFGFCYAAFLVARTLAFGIDVPGYASLMVAVMVLGGVQLLCLGLIGEYLGRLYIEAKGRPLYVVADIFANAAECVRPADIGDGAAPASFLTEIQGWDRRV
jgi:glycosyltransferase involved in cell wall biosynthesis